VLLLLLLLLEVLGPLGRHHLPNQSHHPCPL
jgi:hypothetical protein